MKFSIIIPVYGVEKYLDECIRSVLSQTYTDFEVILVDDKSPDNCPQICDKYAEADARIRVIHKDQNEGLGFARNSGMKIAQGEYLVFVDSDDTIASDTLSAYYEATLDYPDIIASGFTFCYENAKGQTKKEENLLPPAFYADTPQGKADVFALLTENRVFQYAWNKAYRREFLSMIGAQFESTKMIEDYLFNIAVLEKANTVRVLPQSYYFYRKPTHQTLASQYNPEFFSLSKRRYFLAKSFLSAFDEEGRYENLFRKDFIKHCISTMVRNRSKSAGLSKKEQLARIQEIVDDPVTKETVKDFVAEGLVYKIICRMLLKKKVQSLYLFCSMVAKL